MEDYREKDKRVEEDAMRRFFSSQPTGFICPILNGPCSTMTEAEEIEAELHTRIKELEAQLKAAEAREARLREGLELYADEDTLARSFHEEYERACRGTGWETREECKVHFDELPANNKSAMLLTARAVGRVARSLLEVKHEE